MHIELTIHRKGGTRVTMPNIDGKDTAYHFAPQPDGAHVAEVTDERHVGMFLAVPQYISYGAQPVEAATPTKAVAIAPVLEPATSDAPEVIDEDDDGDELTLDEMLRPELMALYAEVYGEKPHPASKDSTLRSRIAERQAELAAEATATATDTAAQAE